VNIIVNQKRQYPRDALWILNNSLQHIERIKAVL
jgi:hypothetical protein